MVITLRIALTLFLAAFYVQLHALEVSISIVATENCSYANGKLRADVTGGTPPYTYAWSNGSTQQIPTMLASGNYSVVVTDSQGGQASANIFLPSGPFLESDLAVTMTFDGLPYCENQVPAGPLFNFRQDAWFMFAGEAPYTFNGIVGEEWNCDGVLQGYLVPMPGAQDGEVVDLAFEDANGCPGTITVTVGHEVQWPSMVLSNVQPACGGQDNGSALLTIGEEPNGQTVWIQLLHPLGVPIMGVDWSITIGDEPIELTLMGLEPGTYQAVQHIVSDECSPLFGVCTSVLEIVIPEEADCACQNPTQFPGSTLMVPTTGQPVELDCAFFGEYSVFGNIQPGTNYEFTVSDNGYITLREGAVGGPVIAQGFSPVTVNATSNALLFAHYNGDASCSTDMDCHTITAARILNCVMPQATFAAESDCATGEITITVDVQSTGDANGVDIVVLGQNPSFADVGPGTYELGPFTSLDGVAVAVVHGEDGDCTVGNLTWQVPDCPALVTCDEAPLQETYCYAAQEDRSWLYAADGGTTLRLQFLRGSIENAEFDQVTIHDGSDANAPILFIHDLNALYNLGPIGSAVNNTSPEYHDVDVVGSSGSLFMTLTSDFSVQCATSANFDAWEWVVSCLDCEVPMGNATVVDGDCATGTFEVALEITSTGDASTVNALYSVNGGSPQSITDLEVGNSTIGPFPLGSNVSISLENANSPECQISLGTFNFSIDCPGEVLCGEPPQITTYCYQNNENRVWTYQTSGSGTLNLRFLRGTIEDAVWDRLRIYDGTDTTGTLVYTNTNTSSFANLGPAGSAVNSSAYPYEEVNVLSTTGSLHMWLTSDGSVSCNSNSSWDVWEWEVVCGTVSLTGLAFLDDDLDCAWTMNEQVVPQTIIEVLPGPIYTTTGQNGAYFLLLDDGSYTIRQVNPYVIDHCAPTPQPFTISSADPEVIIDFPDTAATELDLAVSMSSGAARVGFTHQQAVAIQNLSARTSGPITLTLELPALLLFQEAAPPPTTMVGNTYTWDLPGLDPFQQQSVQIWSTVPVDVGLIGTVMTTTASVSNPLVEDSLANNSTTHLRTITAAYDPNDKVATTSSGASGSSFYIDQDEWIDYTIRFQNTGNDTAFTVVITDTLPSSLDPTTIQMGAASHPFIWDLKGPGILEFTFDNILLPDSFVNEPLSHGFVGFRIRPHLPVMLGDEITNIANIYFDFNPPVITEPSVLVAEFSTGVGEQGNGVQLLVMPNPTEGQLMVRRSGDDLRPGMLVVRGIDGRSMLEERMQGTSVMLNVEALASGVYLLELVTDNGSRNTVRFVKR